MPKLILIPTPIGNLEDITFRAVRVLSEVDLILAEDTRTSSKLLQRYGIGVHMESFHKFNEHKILEKIVTLLQSGKKIALISDAGTPSISDPGFLLVRECVKRGIEIETLPGPSALLPALVNSALPSDRFVFEGFLPLKKGRKRRLEELSGQERTIILYESPYRLLKTLKELELYFGSDRPASVSRELSKIHEENVRGSITQLIEHFTHHTPRGEIVVVIGGAIEKEKIN